MPKYNYSSNSSIDEIIFVENEAGGKRAYLHGIEGLTNDKIGQIILALRHHHIDTTPYELDGKPVLEARGFNTPGKLTGLLKDFQAIRGEPTITKLEEDHTSFIDKLKQRTLQISGILQTIGDLCLLKYGHEKESKLGMAAGVAYNAGTLVLAGYGSNDKSDMQVKDIAKQMQEYFQANHNPVAGNLSMSQAAAEPTRNALQHVHQTFKRYPAEAYNVFTGAAGALVAMAAYEEKFSATPPPGASAQHIKNLKRTGLLDMGWGLITMGSTAYGTVVKEKAPDPDRPPPKHMVEYLQRLFWERPLTVTGGGLLLSTMFQAASTFIEGNAAWKDKNFDELQKLGWRAGFVGCNSLAEILIMVSSKGHGEGVNSDDSVASTAYRMAAEVIEQQPQEEQKWFTHYVASFLERPEVLAVTHAEAVEKLEKFTAQLTHNPWTHKISQSQDQLHPLKSSNPIPKMPANESWQQAIEANEMAANGASL